MPRKSYEWISTDGRREYTRLDDGARVRLITGSGPEGGRIHYWDGYIGKRRLGYALPNGKEARKALDRFHAPGSYDAPFYNTHRSSFDIY